ncbi:general secretion pathway protein L [Steroidobacter denitrificans]|uniref:General secretion pathway protein L n=2 Tax=Steroidobacter denitrificans TaxID=465721 RepID=A0A127FBG5_STEDE|nr:general secretion pathway protein L [Steroidobacter denitrificans]
MLMPEFLVVRLRPGNRNTPGTQGADTPLQPAAGQDGGAVPPADPISYLAEWLIVDGDGVARDAVCSGPLSLAAAAQTPARRLIVLVPGTQVLLVEPVLPPRSGAKLAQIVPFALEEQLAGDLEDQHFAIGRLAAGAALGPRRTASRGTPVAIVTHPAMQAWQAALAAAGLHPNAIYAETEALPPTPNGVTVLIHELCVYLKRPLAPAVVLEVEPLIEALQLALASGEETREHVTIYVGEEDYQRERELLEGLREFTASLQLKLLPQGPLPMLAAQIVQGTAVNLLQGPYQVRTRLNISFAPWRHAAALALVFAALHLGAKSWQYMHDRAAEARLDTQITAIYQQLMPGTPVPAADQARRRVEARLAQLRGGNVAQGMMATLAALGEALAEAPGTNIEALSYRDQITDLRVLVPSVETLDRIRQVAGERGVSAKIESANPRDSKFEGRLQLRNPGV